MRVFVVSVLITSALVSSLGAQGNPSLAHAKLLFDARSWDAARVEYSSIARATPTDATPVLYLGRVALQQNDTDEAIRQFERCVAIDEQNAQCHAWLGNALGMTAPRANKLKLPFLARRTKREFDRAIELDPGSVDGRFGELEYYLNAPGFLGGSIDNAREQAAEIERRDKLRGALAYATIADHEKDVKASELAYERAVAVAPDSVAGYSGLVNLYVRQQRWTDAFATLDRIAAHVPTEHNVPIRIARIAAMSGEHLSRGEEVVKQWLANPPSQATVDNKATAHFRLGQVYEKTSRRELARAEYEQALKINPKQEEARKALDALK